MTHPEPPQVAPQVALHFHPDWPSGPGGVGGGGGAGATVIEALAADGVYRSQFVTGTSNGGLTAHPGGDRWRWESRLFGGRYDEADPADRPVYGAVLAATSGTGPGYGAAPRFGSAYLRLRGEVTARCTFCFPDSVFEPVHVGGPEVLSDLVRRAAARDDLGDLGDLDRYVEAQVHGPVVVARDVEAVVLDPCFRDGPVHAAADRLGCAVDWHVGYRVRTDRLPEDYRGPEPLTLARALGEELVPAVVGAAARTRSHDPQTLKRVWHLLARFGRQPGPVGDGGPGGALS